MLHGCKPQTARVYLLIVQGFFVFCFFLVNFRFPVEPDCGFLFQLSVPPQELFLLLLGGGYYLYFGGGGPLYPAHI